MCLCLCVLLGHKGTKSSAQFAGSCTQHISMHSLPRALPRSAVGAGVGVGSEGAAVSTPAFQTTLSPPGCGVGQLPVSWGTPACSSPTQPTWHCSCQDGNTAKHALSHAHPARLTTFLKTKIWIRTIYRRSKPLTRETWKCGAFRRAW